jgi:hypothetical protein
MNIKLLSTSTTITDSTTTAASPLIQSQHRDDERWNHDESGSRCARAPCFSFLLSFLLLLLSTGRYKHTHHITTQRYEREPKSCRLGHRLVYVSFMCSFLSMTTNVFRCFLGFYYDTHPLQTMMSPGSEERGQRRRGGQGVF